MQGFEFEDSITVSGQTIILKYTQTGQYTDQGFWSAEYSHTGKVLPIQNINLWVWLHQRDINRKISKSVREYEPMAIEKGTKRD